MRCPFSGSVKQPPISGHVATKHYSVFLAFGKEKKNHDPLHRVFPLEVEKLPVMPDNRNMRLLPCLFMFQAWERRRKEGLLERNGGRERERTRRE